MEPSNNNPNAERFSQGVANLLMATEELRRMIVDTDISLSHLIQWQHELEGILGCLESLERWTADAVADTEQDLYRHCQYKAVVVAQQVLNACLCFQEPELDDDESHSAEMIPPEQVRRDAQGVIARLVELNLLLFHSSGNLEGLQTAEKMVESYVSYQRQVLRLRARPAIAELVRARQDGSIVTTPTAATNDATVLKVQVHHDDDDDNDAEEEQKEALPAMRQYHSPVFTVILGEAAALIHPLLAWKVNLPPPPPLSEETNVIEPPMITSIRRLCEDAVVTLDEQAQTLVKRVSDWYWEDRPIDAWMQKSVDATVAEETNKHPQEQKQNELPILDGLVAEMAFSCQVLARYQALVQGTGQDLQTTIGSELLPEWTWKYATLERFLAMQQWQSALELAAPVHIVLGTAVQVPSVVEDAQFLSTRALERAASTRSLQAIGTVAYAVSHDVWSWEMNSGVHQALVERRGCWSTLEDEEKEAETKKRKDETKSDFAAALLDALEDEMGPAPSSKTPPPKPPSSTSRAPISGGFLSSIVGGGEKVQQMKLDTDFCLLNGIHASSGACRSLVAFLDSLLAPEDDSAMVSAADDEKATAMIQLAREELFRYAEGYQTMLAGSVEDVLSSWCGSGKGQPFGNLRLFFEREEYNLDASSFEKLEADERLERDLIGALQSSIFFQQMPEKCDEGVLRLIGEHLATAFVNLIINCLWELEKKFTDWGSLLLSKQVRLLQAHVARVTAPSSGTDESSVVRTGLIHSWERLSQIATVLQLEKPSDWLAYHSTSKLSPDQLNRTLSMRVDFSSEAIKSIVASVGQREEDIKDKQQTSDSTVSRKSKVEGCH